MRDGLLAVVAAALVGLGWAVPAEAEIEAPTSVVGPPMSVAISPKEDIALVTGAMQIDAGDPTKQVPDDKLTVIDLSPLKPSLVARLRSAVGAGPKGAPTVPRCSPPC